MNTENKKEENEQICPNCETGRSTYLLDEHSAVCPYLYCHNGKSCTMYKPIKK